LLEDAENGLSTLFGRLLNQDYLQLCEIDAHIVAYSDEVKRYSPIAAFDYQVAGVSIAP
jgi:hypothetical protein